MGHENTVQYREEFETMRVLYQYTGIISPFIGSFLTGDRYHSHCGDA